MRTYNIDISVKLAVLAYNEEQAKTVAMDMFRNGKYNNDGKITLCEEKPNPFVSPHKKYRVSNIKWDIDDEGDDIMPVLPSEIVIKANCEDNANAVEDYLSDYLSDTFGYCHNGFKYEEVKASAENTLAKVCEIINSDDDCAESMVSKIGELVGEQL